MLSNFHAEPGTCISALYHNVLAHKVYTAKYNRKMMTWMTKKKNLRKKKNKLPEQEEYFTSSIQLWMTWSGISLEI